MELALLQAVAAYYEQLLKSFDVRRANVLKMMHLTSQVDSLQGNPPVYQYYAETPSVFPGSASFGVRLTQLCTGAFDATGVAAAAGGGAVRGFPVDQPVPPSR